MIKRGIVKDKLIVDSHVRKANGSCPLMPEDVCLSLLLLFFSPVTTALSIPDSPINHAQNKLQIYLTNLVEFEKILWEDISPPHFWCVSFLKPP